MFVQFQKTSSCLKEASDCGGKSAKDTSLNIMVN